MKILFWGIVLAIPMLGNMWCIRHAFTHDFPTALEQTTWVRVTTFIPVIGGLAYFIFGRPRALPRGTAGNATAEPPSKSQNDTQ